MVKSTEVPACANLPAKEGTPFTGFLLQLQSLMMKVGEEMMEEGVKTHVIYSWKAISELPIINGTSQFLNLLIIMGITIKKIMMMAWAVTIIL